MKHHECPTCGRTYICRRGASCGSPLVYDCFGCYVERHARDLELAAVAVARRFHVSSDLNGYTDLCSACGD